MRISATEPMLQRLKFQVEDHLENALLFINLKDTELNRVSTNGGWSIAECLEHLNTYGRYYLPNIQAALKYSDAPANPQFKSTLLGNYMVNLMDITKKQRRFRTSKKHLPLMDIAPQEVLGTFIKQQEMMLKLLDQALKADLNRIKIPLSITRLIKFKLGDILLFMVTHNERHIQQARKHITHTILN